MHTCTAAPPNATRVINFEQDCRDVYFSVTHAYTYTHTHTRTLSLTHTHTFSLSLSLIYVFGDSRHARKTVLHEGVDERKIEKQFIFSEKNRRT